MNDNNFLRVQHQIEEACKDAKSVGNPSFVPMGLDWLSSIIDNGESQGYIHKGQTVLDMGSGSGSSSIFWAYRGYNVISIELQPKLVEIAREAVNKCKGIIADGLEVRIYQGSYFPESYLDKRKSGKSFAARAENKISGSGNPGDYLLFPRFQEDVFKKNNINLKDMDVFYAYAWQMQAPSVLEIFKDYARDDATLCMVGPTSNKYVKALGLIPCWDDDSRLEPYWERFVRKTPVKKA
jgi:SAM-dependent methyltransferase